MINDLINEFKKESEIYEKKYVDSNLNKELNSELKKTGFAQQYFEKNNNDYSVKCFKDYYFNTNSYDNKTGEFKFYKEIPVDLSLEEIKTIISFQNNKSIKRIDKNINFITIFVKVWIVLNIIGILIMLFMFLS